MSEKAQLKKTGAQIIYLIRHAHKSLTSVSGDLNALGFAEAEQLIPVFTRILPGEFGLPVPTRIYSQYPYDLLRPPNANTVNRVYQTAQPLAGECGINKPIATDVDWTKNNYFPMVERVIRENHKPTDVPLIVWQHDTLPNIAQELGFPCIRSWGLQPQLHLDSDQTECEFGQLWVLQLLDKQSPRLQVFQMLFPCLELDSCKQNTQTKAMVVAVSSISCAGCDQRVPVCKRLTRKSKKKQTAV